jgi:hypothetical protein
MRGAWDGGAQDPGADGMEDGVEGCGEVRSAVADQELNVLEPLAEAGGEVAGLLYGPLASGVRGDLSDVHPAVPCSMNTSTYSLLRSTVST